MGLADIENHCLVAKQIQIQALPICWALLNEQKSFERNDNLLIVHGKILSRIEFRSKLIELEHGSLTVCITVPEGDLFKQDCGLALRTVASSYPLAEHPVVMSSAMRMDCTLCWAAS
jgi:hypothetical protein